VNVRTNDRCECGAQITTASLDNCHYCGRYLSEGRRRGSRALVSMPEAVAFLLVVGALYAVCVWVACQTDVKVGMWMAVVGAAVVLLLGYFLARNVE
jgi:membrane associated rhomboid family serine protease